MANLPSGINDGPNAIIRGLGEDDSRKKTRRKKSRNSDPLRPFIEAADIPSLDCPPPPSGEEPGSPPGSAHPPVNDEKHLSRIF